MEEWRARLAGAREALMEDDDESELEMQMALDQLQEFIDFEVEPRRRAGGSRIGKSPNIERARVAMDNQMYLDYFADPPIWGPSVFRRRYRMRRSLFNTILEKVCVRDSYFVQRRDACGLIGLSSRQKITAALRMLSLGVCADAMDDYCRTSESTAMECMKRFCVAVRAEFGDFHLRQLRKPILSSSLRLMRNADFLVCLHRWIVCITSGKIAQWPGKVTLETGRGRSPSFWKQLLTRAYTFGIFSLVSLAQTMMQMS